MTEEGFARLRWICMGVTGLVCLGYGAAVLLSGRPDPVWYWIPGAFGLAAAAITWGIGWLAPAAARRASDEGYLADWQRAQRHAFWVALLMFPAGSVAVALGLLDGAQVLAMGGVLSAGTVLLLLVIYDLRGRR